MAEDMMGANYYWTCFDFQKRKQKRTVVNLFFEWVAEKYDVLYALLYAQSKFTQNALSQRLYTGNWPKSV